MNKKIFSSILLSIFLTTNNIAFAETLALNNTQEDTTSVTIPAKKLENEINSAITQIYGEEYAPQIYQRVMEIAQKAISERPEELKKEDLTRAYDWYKDEIIYMFYVDQFGTVTPEKPNQFKDTAEMFEYLQDLGVTTLYLLPFRFAYV